MCEKNGMRNYGNGMKCMWEKVAEKLPSFPTSPLPPLPLSSAQHLRDFLNSIPSLEHSCPSEAQRHSGFPTSGGWGETHYLNCTYLLTEGQVLQTGPSVHSVH